MDKRTKLKKILEVLDPQKGTAVDFAALDSEVAKLKSALLEKVQITTLDDVNSQLDKFKKKLDLTPILEAVNNLETSLNLKIQGVTGRMTEENANLKRLLAQQTEVSTQSTSSLATSIGNLETELQTLETQKNTELASIKKLVSQLQDAALAATDSFLQMQQSIEENGKVTEAEFKKYQGNLEAVRIELLNRINNLGGGSKPLMVSVNSSVASARYADVNFLAGNNVTLTASDDNTLKQSNIVISATGGGTGNPGGSDTQIQFNDGGSFNASSVLTFNKSTSIVTSPTLLDTGYLRVGSGAVVGSAANGDVYATRVYIGTTSQTSERPLDVRGTMTQTANGGTIFSNFINTINPASNSLADFRAINFQNIAGAAAGVTLDTIEAGHFEGARFGATQSGAINTIKGIQAWGGVPDSSAYSSILVTGFIAGVHSQGIVRPSGSANINSPTVYAYYGQAVNGANASVVTAYGIQLDNNVAGSSIATAIGADIVAQTRGYTNNIGLQIDKSSGGTGLNVAVWLKDQSSVQSGGILFGNDTPLYRSNSSILAVGGAIQVNAVSIVGGTSQSVTIQPASVAGNWNLTLPNSAGSNAQYLMTDGNGVTQWASVTATGGSGITRTVSIITANTTGGTTGNTDYTYFVNAGLQFTLPTAIGNSNLYTIKNRSASSVLIATSAGQTIDDSNTALMDTNYQSLSFISNGSIWGVV